MLFYFVCLWVLCEWFLCSFDLIFKSLFWLTVCFLERERKSIELSGWGDGWTREDFEEEKPQSEYIIYIFNKKKVFYNIYLVIIHVCVLVCIGVCWCSCGGGQRTACGNQLFPSFMCTPGIELRPLDLAASKFACLIALLDQSPHFKLHSFNFWQFYTYMHTI